MTPPKLTLLLVALAAVSACGPPTAELPRDIEAEAVRFAEAVCGAREECSCDDEQFASRDACELEFVGQFMAQIEDGLAFNPDCFDALLLSESLTCAEWPWDYHYWVCPTLEGSAREGDACVEHDELLPLYANDCAGGLYCYGGVCVREIEPIRSDIGEPCVQESASNCITDAWCGDDGTCHARTADGEPCADFHACELGSFCLGFGAGNIGTCTELLELGESCDPRDWNSCGPDSAVSTWTTCRPSGSGHVCEPQTIGVCHLTFPF